MEETKKCPFCQKDIPILATKCPYCQSIIRPETDYLKLIGTAFAIVFGFFIVMGIIVSMEGTSNQRGSSATNSSSSGTASDLKVKITPTTYGVNLTNLEGQNWTDCMLGFNGGTGWNFNDPPYQTRSLFSVPAGQQVSIAYKKITTEDGTQFDSTTHRIDTVVILCNKNNPGSWRSWVGTAK